MRGWTVEEIVADLREAARVKPKPTEKSKGQVVRLVDHERSTEGVINAATNANLALAERMEKQKQITNTQNDRLASWWQSVLAARAHWRFEMEGK